MDIFNEILNIIILIIGLIGIIVIIIGITQGFWMFIKGNTFWQIRLTLVKHILLGLDFLIGKDIIETVIIDTNKILWIDLAILILIISIRVIFSHFTSKEMKDIEGVHSFNKL